MTQLNTPLTCFTLTESSHIAHLVLNKPEAMNTMHPTFWRELDAALTHIHAQGTARALVISSTGKHFSAGMALETFAGAIQMDDQSPEGRAAIFDVLTDMQATFTKIENLRIPVIAAIQGGCIGGAVDMVTACCIRYASADAFFCIQEINIGMVADVGTLQRLPKLIPLADRQRAGLHRPAHARCPGPAIRPGERRAGHARSRHRSRAAMRRRDRQQAAHCPVGHQAGPALRARPFRGRFTQANGLAARCHLEQPPCDGGRDGDEDQAPGRFSGAQNPAPLQRYRGVTVQHQ